MIPSESMGRLAPTSLPEARLGRRQLLSLPLGLSLALVGCDEPARSARGRVDVAWHRTDLMDNLLTPWLEHSTDPSGIFWGGLKRDWKTVRRDTVELTHQARLVYAFAQGYEWTSDRRHIEAARRGADFMLRRLRDPEHGGFFHSVKFDGQPVSTHKETYGQAFALLALATLARVGEDPTHRSAATQLWQTLSTRCMDPQGGVYKDLNRDFTPMPGNRSQNPLMHLFEAVLALYTATGASAAQAGVRSLGDFVTNKLLQGLPDGGARIPEWYDEQWKPLATKAEGGYFELGHQFEWVHLFTSAGLVQPVYIQVADRILSYTLATAYDENRGGCLGRAFPDEPKVDPSKGWWQQAECLHALVICAQNSGRSDLWRRYEQTVAFVKEELIDPYQGGWQSARALPCKTGGCDNDQPDPYHMVSLHSAALRTASA